MPKILFFAEGVSLAHVVRPFKLASSLSSEWEIHFACTNKYQFLLEKTNWTQHALESIPPEQFLKRLHRGAALFTEEELKTFVKEDLSLIQKIKPDIIVGDMRLSLSVSARKENIPYISISNAHWCPEIHIASYPVPDITLTRILGLQLATPLFHIFRPLAFKLQATPLNNVRKLYGMEPLENICYTYTDSDHTLLADSRQIIPTQHLPLQYEYIGPIAWSPKIALPQWWNELPNGPKVYITLGSTGDSQKLPEILEIIENLGMMTLVATAGRINMKSIPQRRYVADFLPGDLAADKSEFVICNGGSATAYQSLIRGRPVLGICSNMDQFLTMSFIKKFGAGLLVRSDQINKSELENKLQALKTNTQFKIQAQQVMNEFTNFPIEKLFPQILMKIIPETHKIQRLQIYSDAETEKQNETPLK